MNILHLSTHDTRGGAARSAWRLHQGLLSIGSSSRMLVRTKHSDSSTVLDADDGTLASWHEQIATPWFQSLIPEGSSWFTTGSTNAGITDHPWVREADILHLHWVAEWLSVADIASLAALGKPIYWTFHDLWAVSCGNHYAGSNTPLNDHWQSGENLPTAIRDLARREYERKLQFLAPLPIQVIAPSHWCAGICRQSQIGQHWEVSVVPYSIDTSVFRPESRSIARKMLGLPLDGTLLLFGAASLSDPRKGFPHICEALPKEEGVELVLFGADQVDQTIVNVPIKHFGQISDERQMARLFAAADAYLCPTLEDNLPNTVIESLCCGTPVIGYATGGMVDMVIHGRNGLLAPTGSVECLRKLLSDFVSDPATRHALQQFDEKRYDFEIQARCVEKLYRERFGSQSSVTQGADLPELDCSWFRSAAVYAASRSNAQVSALRAKLEKSQLKLAQVKKAVESGPEKRKKRWWRF